MSLKCFLGVVVALWVFAAQTADAQAPRFVVDPGVPAEIDERIVGQTGDLDWTRAPGTATDVDDAPLSRATAVAQGGARVVVRVEDQGTRLLVTIVDLEQRRVLQREITIRSARERSAALEAAALVVRGALQTLRDGGEIGVRAPPPPTRPETEVEDEEPAVERPLPASPRVRALRLGLGVGAAPVVEGAWSASVGATLMGEIGALALSVTLGGLVPRRVDGQDSTQLQLGALYAGARIGYAYRGPIDLLPNAGLRVYGIRRLTSATAAGFAPTGATRTPQARALLGVMVRARFGRLGLFADLGLEMALSRVRFAADAPSGRMAVAVTPRVVPMLQLGVSLDLAAD